MDSWFENNCGYFLVLFLPLVQAKNRTLCNNQRHKVYFLMEMFNANTSGQCFGFVSVPFLQPGKVTWNLALNQRHKRFSQQNMVSVLWLRKELCNSTLYFSSCNPLVTVCCSHYELMLQEIVPLFKFFFFITGFSNWMYLLPIISKQRKRLPRACPSLSISVTKIYNLVVEDKWFILSGKYHFSKWLSGHVWSKYRKIKSNRLM